MRLSLLALAALALALAPTACSKKKADDEPKKAAPKGDDDDKGKPGKKGEKGDKGDDGDKPAEPKKAGKAGAGCKVPEGNEIKADYTIPAGCKLVVEGGDLLIRDGAVLTIEKGSTLSFKANGLLSVEYGSLVAKGTAEEPIVFTSDNKSPAAGDWQGIVFHEQTSAGVTLDHVKIAYAGRKGGWAKAAVTVDNGVNSGRVTLTNSVVEHNDQAALSISDEKSKMAKCEGNTFKDNAGTSLQIAANVFGSIGANTFGDPIRIEGHIRASQTWPKLDVPVIVGTDLVIEGEKDAAIVTIPEKAVVKVNLGFLIEIGAGNGGGIVAKNVTFTSANATPNAGDWQGLLLREKTTGTVLDGCTFEYAGKEGGWAKAAITFDGDAKSFKGVKVTNATFKNNGQAAFASNDHDCGDHVAAASANKSAGVPLCKKE